MGAVFRLHRRLTFDHYLCGVQEMLHQLGGYPKLETAGVREAVLLSATVAIGHDVVLDVFEAVEKTADGRAHRTKYRYKCFLAGQPVFRYEYEPSVHPEPHKHLPDGSRMEWKRVQLAEVLNGMWDEIDAERHRRLASSTRLSA